MSSPATTRTAERLRAAEIPPLPYGFTPRNQLLRIINEPFLAPVTLVTAPAGYGKTTAVCHWARDTSMPVAWVEVTTDDNAPGTLLSRLVDALLTHNPAIEADNGPDLEASVGHVVRHCGQIAEMSGAVAIVLDDFEFLDSLIVLDEVTTLANALPDHVHLVIVSRTIPNLGIGRLRTLRRVRDIGARQLAFDTSQALVHVREGGRWESFLPGVEDMVRRAEGWIAGLLLTLGTSSGIPGLERGNGFPAYDHLDAYVEEEVLAFLPSELRDFVLETSLLDRLDVGLCDHVTGTGSARTTLDDLVRRGVFLEREPDGSHRYNRLFADSVQRICARERAGEEVRALYHRAADWHLERRQVWRAIEQYINAEDWDRCTELLKPLLHDMAGQERRHTMLKWLRRLPEHVLFADHELTYHHAYSLLTIGPRKQGVDVYERWIRPWHDSAVPMLRARADACAALIAFSSGDHDAMLRSGRNLLEMIPLTEPAKRIGPLMGIIEVEFTRGNDDAVQKAMAEATRIRLQFSDDHHEWMMQLVSAPANMHALRGDLEGARDIYEHEVREFAGSTVDLNRRIGYRLAFIALAQDRLDDADALLGSYDEDMPLSLLGRWRLNSLVCRAQALRLRGDLAGSESLLLELVEQSRTEQDKVITEAARAVLASIWVERGELSLVRRWLMTADESVQPWAHIFGIPNHQLVKAEALIVLDRVAEALQHLELVIADGTERKRWAELVQAHVYHAVALERTAKRHEAIRAIGEAVTLGAPGGFIQPFLTPFEEVLALLERLKPSRATNRYVARVIESVRKRSSQATASPLSDREREILQLAQAGSGNQEIANRLFISQATVKRHLANVNLKLGTRNRVQAIARARELHLI